MASREAILEMFGSIKTDIIKMFDERYIAVTEAAVAATIVIIIDVRPHMSDMM